MKTTEAVKAALEAVRNLMARCEGDEKSLLEAFDDAFCSEAAGWQMRLDELRAEEGDE